MIILYDLILTNNFQLEYSAIYFDAEYLIYILEIFLSSTDYINSRYKKIGPYVFV